MREWEQRLLSEQMRGFPSPPWLWLAPNASWLPELVPQGRGLRLHREDGRLRLVVDAEPQYLGTMPVAAGERVK